MKLVATKTEHRGGNTYVEEYTVVDVAKQEKTLRDEFAMAALTGFIARGQGSVEEIAEGSYIMADALMKAREK